MKVDVIKKTIEFNTIEIEYPIYCYLQNDNEGYEILIKITETCFYKIRQDFTGYEINHQKNNGSQLPELYYNNQTTKEHYERVLKDIKSYFSDF